MESAINKVVLSGFAGADAEIKTFGNQKLARRLSIADCLVLRIEFILHNHLG